MARETYIFDPAVQKVVTKDEYRARDRGGRRGAPVKVKHVQRGSWVWRDGKLVAKHLAPPRMHRGQGLQVIKDIEPFQNVAVDWGVIGGRRQRRDMMRAHGLEEVGNDAPVNRKQDAPFNAREFAEDVKQGYREHGVDVL